MTIEQLVLNEHDRERITIYAMLLRRLFKKIQIIGIAVLIVLLLFLSVNPRPSDAGMKSFIVFSLIILGIILFVSKYLFNLMIKNINQHVRKYIIKGRFVKIVKINGFDRITELLVLVTEEGIQHEIMIGGLITFLSSQNDNVISEIKSLFVGQIVAISYFKNPAFILSAQTM